MEQNYLFENSGVDIGKRNDLFFVLIHAQVVQHGLDGDGLASDLHVNGEDFAVGTLQLDDWHTEGLKLMKNKFKFAIMLSKSQSRP